MIPVRKGRLLLTTTKRLRRSGAGGARSIQAGLSRRAVRIARVDGDHAHQSPGRPQMLHVILSGAAMTRFDVNAAAALAGGRDDQAKSVRPLFFSPALIAPNLKP